MATHQQQPPQLPEHQELSEQLPHAASVECICCSEEWESGHQFVEESLRELRAQQEQLQEAGESELPVRYGLEWLAASTARLLRDADFELITCCVECRVERAREHSREWVQGHAPAPEHR